MAKEAPYPYPSRFGSHTKMVVSQELSSAGNLGDIVTCQDEFGEYTTEVDRLDNGRADPNRYATSRLSKLFGGGST